MLDNIAESKPFKSASDGAVLYNAPEGREKVHIERTQEKLQRAEKAFKEWTEAIKQSEKTRSELLIAASDGAEEKEILKKSIECIYQITGDKAFYNTIMERLQ